MAATLDIAIGSARSVWRSPRLTFAISATLALGLGANVIVFSIVDRLLLSPPDGIRAADDVRRLFVERPHFRTREPSASSVLTFPDYEAFRKLSTFTDVAAYTSAFERTLGRGEDATRIRAKTASPGFFPLLGVQPVLGRLFSPDDALSGAEPTVVLTESFWRRQFGGDPGVLGRTLDIGDGSYTVIGVSPGGFIGVDLEPADIFLEFTARADIEMGPDEWRGSRNWWWLLAVGRLAPHVSASAAEAAATAAFRAARPPERADDQRVVTSSLVLADSPDAPSELDVTRWLAGVSLFVLIIACANVANLLLVRAERRRQELAVQRALGMSRRRLVAQLQAESLLLATIGGAVALMVAQWGGAVFRAELFPQVEFGSVFANGRVLAFAGVAVLLATGVAGLAPALRCSRADVLETVRDGARGATAHRSKVRAGFVAIQAGLTLVLLVGAGLFVRSLREALDVDLGFDADALLTASLELEADPPREDRVDTYYRALEEVGRLPWVSAATFTAGGPFQGSLQVRLAVEGWDSLPRIPGGGPYAYPVAPGYFETLGIEVLRGRTLTTEDDRSDTPLVAAVNETMAETLWPGGNALGRCLFIREGPCTHVVGVVSNTVLGGLVEEPSMMFYVPFRRALEQPASTLIVRSARRGGDAVGSLRPALMEISSDIRYVRIRSYAEIIEPQLRSWRVGAAVFTALGFLAMLVAAVGLYSSLAFEVASRRRELGIRSALGAPANRLLGAVVRDTVGAAIVGVLVGLVVSLPLARGLEALLFGISALDPLVFASATLAVLTLAAISAAVPSWCAVRADSLMAIGCDD